MSTATLTWTNPTSRLDGTPLSPADIASIDLFDDLGDGNGPQQIASLSGPDTNFTTQVLSVGSHTFTNVVNDTTGHSSTASNGAQLTVPPTLAAPSPVTDLAATLNP